MDGDEEEGDVQGDDEGEEELDEADEMGEEEQEDGSDTDTFKANKISSVNPNDNQTTNLSKRAPEIISKPRPAHDSSKSITALVDMLLYNTRDNKELLIHLNRIASHLHQHHVSGSEFGASILASMSAKAFTVMPNYKSQENKQDEDKKPSKFK